MRCKSILLPLLMTRVSSGMAHSPRQAVDSSQAETLPSCVTTCSTQLSPTYGCQPNTACFCTNSQLSTALEACITANCTIPEGIAAKKFQADTCGYPVRSQVSTGEGVLWAFFTIAIIFSILRCVSRCRMLGGAGYWWDDWTCLVCVLPMIGITITGYLGYQHGMGRDFWEVGVSGIEESTKLFYAGEPLYIAVVYGTKISLVLLYLRIWSKDSRNLNMACWIVIGLLAALFVSFEFATIFQCIPVSYNWTSVVDRTATGSCTDRLAQIYTAAAFNIFFDVLVLLLPVPSLLKLNISWMKKLGVGIVFMVGILVTICSIVRLSYLSKYGNSTNITWNYAYIGMWSLLEVHLSIVCVCVPAAAGLFYRTWRHVKHGSPAESMDLDDRSNRDEKQMLGGNSDTMPPRTLQTTAQVSGLGSSNLDLESGASAKSDDGSSSPPDFDEVRNNLGDKDKQRPPYELHGNSENSHDASTSRPALHEKKKSSESRGSGSNTRPALPSQSQSNESHVLGNDRPILLSPTESKERQEKYRAFQTQPDMRESQFRPAMQSPGTSEESIDRSAPLSPASPQPDEARPGLHSKGPSKDGEQRPALESTNSQRRPSLHSRAQSRDSQGRPSPLSPGQLHETMVAGTARPSFYEHRPSAEFEPPTDQHPAFRSDEQSQWGGQSVDGDRPSLYNSGQSKDGQSMYSGRPGLFSPPSKDNQSYYSDRPVLHSSQSNDGSMAYRPSFDSQGYSRDQIFQARPAFFAQGPSSSQQWQSNMSSRGQSRDGSTARPALFSQFQSKDSQARPLFLSPGQSKDTGSSNVTRPALNSSGTSRQGYNDEDIQDNIAAASAMVGVGALEQQDQQHPLPPAKSPVRSSYTKSPQAQSPGVNEHDQSADLAATIADALVGVRQMQHQLAMKNEESEPEPKSPSKSSQDTRNDSATETTEKPLSSPWSFNGRSKSYRDQADTASPAGSPLASPFSSLGSPNTMAGRDHPLRSQGRQTSFEGEKLRQRAATIESEARERPLEETQSPKTPKTPKSARFETRAAEEEQRRLDATEVAAPEAVGVAATVAATATVPAAAAAALGEKRELTRRSRSESELKEDIEERKRAEAWRPITPSISRSASHEEHPLNSAPRHNPYEDEQMRKGAGTQTDFPYESEENLAEPQPERMSPELQHYKRQRAAESEAALADAYYEHMERKYSQTESVGPYEEEHKATRRAERAARRAASAASDVEKATPHTSQDIGEMLSAMASAVGEVGDQPAEEDRNRAGMDEVAQVEAAMDDNPLRGLRTSDPIETELEAEQATELAIADAAPPPTIHRSRSNSRSSRPDPSPIQRRHRSSNEKPDVYELDGGSAPPPTIYRSRSNSASNNNNNYRYTSRRAGEDSGAESATENDHPLRSQGKSALYSQPNSRPTSLNYRRRTYQSDSAAESANEDDHPLRSQGRSGLYPNNSTESLDAAQTRNASVVAIKAAAEQRRARQKRRQSGNSVQSAKSDSSTEILYEGRANAKKEKTYKSFVTEPARPLGRGASPRGYNGAGRGGDGYGNGNGNRYGYANGNGGGRGYYREPSPMSSNSEEYRVRVTERPGSGGSRELRMPFREWEGDEEGW